MLKVPKYLSECQEIKVVKVVKVVKIVGPTMLGINRYDDQKVSEGVSSKKGNRGDSLNLLILLVHPA